VATFKRYLNSLVSSDLEQKMVFLGGPRQVGKTTLSRQLLPKKQSRYMNWDNPEDREFFLSHKYPVENFLVFDELHKFKDWRNYIKGLFDTLGTQSKILVTGSARLDYYRFSGDSLQGRYHYLRLHPLSVAELGIKKRMSAVSVEFV